MINRKQVKKVAVDSTNGESEKEYEVIIKVKIGEKIIEQDLDNALYIPTADKLNPTMVSDMMAVQPSQHARWNVLYNEAVYDYDNMKTKYEVWTAKKAQEIRKEFSKIENSGRITEKMIEEAMKLDPEYDKMNDDLATSKKNMKNILALANGLGEKGERIVSIASLLKWEGENLSPRKGEKVYNHIKGPSSKREKEYKFDDSNGGWPAVRNDNDED